MRLDSELNRTQSTSRLNPFAAVAAMAIQVNLAGGWKSNGLGRRRDSASRGIRV
jgi:hypothetical protein